MLTRLFEYCLDDSRVVAAIREAESRTTGEIRVFVSRWRVADPVESARREFLRLGVHRTRERNGVLLFFAPRSRGFAVVGDWAIHVRAGDALWMTVAGEMCELLRSRGVEAAVLAGVDRVGAALAEHFPRAGGDVNELPDGVVRG